MTDTVLRVLAREAGVRLLVCRATELTREAGRRHKGGPLATAALGHALVAGALLGARLKVRQRVALKFEADGPLGKLVVEADAYGRVRGYVANPGIESPDVIGVSEVADAIGRAGLLIITKDIGLRDLAHGATELTGQGPEQDVLRHLKKSEQIAALVEIDVVTTPEGAVAAAGGLLVDLLPGQSSVVLDRVAERLAGLPRLGDLLLDGQSLEQIAAQVMGDLDYLILEDRPVAFVCSCSRDRSRQALKVLDSGDILELIVEGEAVIDCHFCHERYVFSPQELMEIYDEMEAIQ